MKILVDAHISHAIVAFLRDDGHDCTEAAYLPLGMPDVDVLAIAVSEKRIVMTADKDFGELVFRDSLAVPGVILLRLGRCEEDERVEFLRTHWLEVQRRVEGHFVTVERQRVRGRPLE